jgi:hypothetical protein
LGGVHRPVHDDPQKLGRILIAQVELPEVIHLGE